MAKLPAGACKDEQLPGKQILEQLVKGRTGMCTSGTGASGRYPIWGTGTCRAGMDRVLVSDLQRISGDIRFYERWSCDYVSDSLQVDKRETSRAILRYQLSMYSVFVCRRTGSGNKEKRTLFCLISMYAKMHQEMGKFKVILMLKLCQNLLKKNWKQGTIILGRNWFYLCGVMQ